MGWLSWIMGAFPQWQKNIRGLSKLARWLDGNLDGFPKVSDLKEKWRSGKAAQKVRVCITFASRVGNWLESSFNDFPDIEKKASTGETSGQAQETVSEKIATAEATGDLSSRSGGQKQ